MSIKEIYNKIYSAENRENLFDSMCHLFVFLENNDSSIFFENKKSKTGEIYKIIKNEYTIDQILKIFQNRFFVQHTKKVLLYHREYGYDKSIPKIVEESGQFLNLSLNLAFFSISYFSSEFKQQNMHFIAKQFNYAVKVLEKELLYAFTKFEILQMFEDVNFNAKYSFKKDYPIKFIDRSFYLNLTKTRLLIGYYLIDLYLPILLSKKLKKIAKIKDQYKDDFRTTQAVSLLQDILKKEEFLKQGLCSGNMKNPFDSDARKSLESFFYFFETKETNKIIYLLKVVLNGLKYNDKKTDFWRKILIKIDDSEKLNNEIKEYFFKNFSIFPEYSGSQTENQWSNKSFLNTIKFLSLISTIKKANDGRWKTNTFKKHFLDWVDDIHDNVNYFSEIDDWDILYKILKGGECDVVEFKATFGYPIEDVKNKEHKQRIKREILGKISETILAMANSSGGNIIIGVVEKPEKIKNEKIIDKLVHRNNYTFLDVEYSLGEEKEDLDSKRLFLQQKLNQLTRERMDFLDSLFQISFLKVFSKDDDKYINLININVKKSQRLLFIKKDESGIPWITLPKRLNGRVELVNPEEEIRNK